MWVAAGLASGAIAAVLTGLGTRRGEPLGGALLLLAGAYAAVLAIDDLPLDRRAPFVAAGLLLGGETSFRALEVATTSPDEPGGAARETARTALFTLGAFAGSLGVIAAADGFRARGILVELTGAAAAVAAFALLARSTSRAEES